MNEEEYGGNVEVRLKGYTFKLPGRVAVIKTKPDPEKGSGLKRQPRVIWK